MVHPQLVLPNADLREPSGWSRDQQNMYVLLCCLRAVTRGCLPQGQRGSRRSVHTPLKKKTKTAQLRYIYNKLYICNVCTLSFAIPVVTFTTIKIMNIPFMIELEESRFILFHNYLISYARHCAGWERNTDLPCRTSLPGKWVPGPGWHERGDTSAWEGCVEKGRIQKSWSEEMVF